MSDQLTNQVFWIYCFYPIIYMGIYPLSIPAKDKNEEFTHNWNPAIFELLLQQWI